jgi:fatty acid synthase subunit alpha, fungi type
MGLISFHSGPLADKDYVGWIDSKTKEPIADAEIGVKFGSYILSHCGVRPIEPTLFDGYDPRSKMFLQQVALEVSADFARKMNVVPIS